jgi:hypothetical protein
LDLKSLILHELLTDDSSTDCEGDCQRIRQGYAAANTDRKAALDDIFISLTGYGLGTLIDKASW